MDVFGTPTPDKIERLMWGLMTLLDRIEVEEDSTLARQRFEMAEQAGYQVVFSHQMTATHQ